MTLRTIRIILLDVYRLALSRNGSQQSIITNNAAKTAPAMIEYLNNLSIYIYSLVEFTFVQV